MTANSHPGMRMGAAAGLLAAAAIATETLAQGAPPAGADAPTAPQIAQFGMVQHGTPACASCHGFAGQGEREQNAPRLAGLDADYLVRQLHAFKAGGKTGRDDARMTAVARTLSDDQIQSLADYYATLPPPAPARQAEAARDLPLGRKVAQQGNWAEKVPPCASCHGVDGLGVGGLSPAIAGQRADYIQRELVRFRQNERRDDPLGLMRGISARLSMREIRAVAAYYATLPSAPPPAAPPPARKASR